MKIKIKMKMKIKWNKEFIWPSLLVLLFIVSAVIFHDQQVTADTNAISNLNNSNENENANNNNQPSLIDNSNQNTNNLPADRQGDQFSTINYSLPVLMYHHIRDFNDPADKIGTGLSVSPADFVKQLDLIESRGYKTITFQDVLIGNVPDKAIILTFDDGYDNFYLNAYPEILRRGMKAVSYIIVNDVGKKDYMTESQIVEIGNSGIEIGSHTLSHPDLSTSSETKDRKEILNSKTLLEKMTGKRIVSLCYPSGKFSASTEVMVKEAGYSFAVTTKGGNTTFADPFALNRHRVNNDTSIEAWVK